MLCLYIATDWNPDSLMSVESWMIVPGVFAAAILAYLISLFMTIGDDPVTTQTVVGSIAVEFLPAPESVDRRGRTDCDLYRDSDRHTSHTRKVSLEQGRLERHVTASVPA